MPSTLECVLMRKCKIKKNDARRLVTLGQESLGTHDVEWSAQLEKECIRIHKEKEKEESQDRYSGLSPYLAFKVKEHEKAFNTRVEIKPLRTKKKKGETTDMQYADPLPTFQESATTKNLPPIARKKAVSPKVPLPKDTPQNEEKCVSKTPTKPVRMRSRSPVSNVKSEPSKVPQKSKTAPPKRDKVVKPSKSKARAASPSLSQSMTSVSVTSVMSESSTSEMSSSSVDRPTTVGSAAPPPPLPVPRPSTPPPQLSGSPLISSADAALSPEISYKLPGEASSAIESPTKRLAKLATMSIVSPMIRTKKMAVVSRNDFSPFEAPLNTPTHGRRRRRRVGQRNVRRSTSSNSNNSLTASVHSVGDGSLSSAGSDSVQSYKAFSSRKKQSATADSMKSSLNVFLKSLLADKTVEIVADDCPGRTEDCDESGYDTPSLLGVSDSEYESDAMYESDKLDDFDFFGDDGSVGSNCSNTGAVYIDMPTLEAAQPRYSRTNNPYDSNDEDSFSDDSEEMPKRRFPPRARSLEGNIVKKKGNSPPARAASFDGVTGASSTVRKGRRPDGKPPRELPQRAASFDIDDLNGKGRKRDAV